MKYLLEKPIVASIGIEKFKVTIEWRNGKIIADEPEEIGGKDLDPDQYPLLLALLASSWLGKLLINAKMKEWEIS